MALNFPCGFLVLDRFFFCPPQGESSFPPALPPQLSSEERKEQWEQGQADYMGMDSFDNIKRKLDTFLK